MKPLEASDPAAGRHPVPVRTTALVALAAGLWLALLAPVYHAGRLHLGAPFIDQIVHITTARNLAETGKLTFGLVFPAYVDRPDWRPYMPGHVWTLAASYRLLGFGVLSSLLPNLIAFVVAAAAVFVGACRLYGRGPGLAACALFCAFPGATCYAFTAMQDPTFVAASAVALAAFACAPPRARPWVVPAGIALAYVFRESAMLLSIPMAWTVWRTHPRPARSLAAAGVLSLLVVQGLDAWQSAQGKDLELFSFVLRGNFNYRDAYLPPLDASLGAILAGIPENLARNAGVMAEQLGEAWFQLSTVGLALLLAASIACTVLGWRARARDAFALGAGLLGLAVIAAVFLVYDVKGQKAMRTALFTLPALCIGLAGAVDGRAWLARLRGGRGAARIAAGAAALVVLGLLGTLTVSAARELRASDPVVDATLAELDALDHDDSQLIIVAHDVFSETMAFAVWHWPVPWSFLPSNEETLDLMLERYRVGTLIVYSRAAGSSGPQATALGGELRFVKPITINDREYYVYQRPR